MKTIKEIIELLDGYKTYLLIGAGLFLWFGVVANQWTMAQVEELFTLLGILGVGATRSAIKKLEK